jgi:hypothetical protein
VTGTVYCVMLGTTFRTGGDQYVAECRGKYVVGSYDRARARKYKTKAGAERMLAKVEFVLNNYVTAHMRAYISEV